MEELIESLDEQDKELIGFIETKVASGGNNIVALRLNKEVNEELRECLLDTYIFLRQKNVSDISLGMVFEAHSDPKTEVLVSRPLGDKLEKQYEDEFNLLVLYDKDAPEEIKNKISDKIWGRKPLAMQNAAYLRDCAEKYLKYKKLCADKLGVRYHISVPEFCAVIGVPTWEWVEYETEGQIKDVKDFFTNLVLAQGSATLQDPYMKNPIGVMKVLQNFAGFKDQSELKVLQKEKRRVIINRHSREKKKQEQG
jgi:hypothetical protein